MCDPRPAPFRPAVDTAGSRWIDFCQRQRFASPLHTPSAPPAEVPTQLGYRARFRAFRTIPSHAPQAVRGSALSISQTALLRKYGLRLDKRLGQHFLDDRRVLSRIVAAVRDLGPEQVVELGPGAGALTFALLDEGLPVHGLELDDRMIELLRAEAAGRDLRVTKTDLAREDLAQHVHEADMAFAGNLPYQITSIILFALMPALSKPNCRGAVVMMQSEVARRLVASPGTKEYGILTVLLGSTADIRRLFVVKPGSFLPPPRVDSAVVELKPRANPENLTDSCVSLVKDLFQQRRKQVGGLLRRRNGLSVHDVQTLEAQVGFSMSQRPEQLTRANYMELDAWLQEHAA